MLELLSFFINLLYIYHKVILLSDFANLKILFVNYQTIYLNHEMIYYYLITSSHNEINNIDGIQGKYQIVCRPELSYQDN